MIDEHDNAARFVCSLRENWRILACCQKGLESSKV